MENNSQYFVFLLRRLWGVRERHVLPKRERLLVGQKKTKYDIFLEKIWKENFVLWVFHLETLRALPSEFQIGRVLSAIRHLANFDYLPNFKVLKEPVKYYFAYCVRKSVKSTLIFNWAKTLPFLEVSLVS